jgi:hypothetical protein
VDGYVLLKGILNVTRPHDSEEGADGAIPDIDEITRPKLLWNLADQSATAADVERDGIL